MCPGSPFSLKSAGRPWATTQVLGAHGLLEVEEIHSVSGQKAEGYSWAGAQGCRTQVRGEGEGDVLI